MNAQDKGGLIPLHNASSYGVSGGVGGGVVGSRIDVVGYPLMGLAMLGMGLFRVVLYWVSNPAPSSLI